MDLQLHELTKAHPTQWGRQWQPSEAVSHGAVNHAGSGRGLSGVRSPELLTGINLKTYAHGGCTSVECGDIVTL